MDRGESESEQLRSELPELKSGKGRQRYEQLRSYRDAWLQRAQRASRLTLPYLIPDSAEGMQDQSQELAMPWSGIGGIGVNNLAARLLLALLPPTGGFFRLTGDELDTAMAEADLRERGTKEEDVAKLRQEIEKGLAMLERAVSREIEVTNDRVALFEALMHLIVGGAVLLYRRTNGMKVFHLSRHVLLRDPMGAPVEGVACETYLYASLDPSLRAVLDAMDRSRGKWQEDGPRRDGRQIQVFTHVKWEKGKVNWYQEIGGAIVPGTEGNKPIEESPWIPLRLYRCDGDSYGPGYVEWCAIADLINNEALSKAATETQMQVARNLVGRQSSAITSKEQFAKAPNGAVIDAQKDDFFPIPTANAGDLSVAYQGKKDVEQRLYRMFLMPDIRDSERTTAEEVRLQIQQIQQMLGAIYSILTVEFQYPYIRRVMAVLSAEKGLPEIPDVEPVVSVGLVALGRQSDAEKLAAFASQAGAALPAQFAQMLDAPAWLREFALAMGVNPLLIKSDKRIREEALDAQRQLQQQQLFQAGMGDPQKLANAGLAVQQMAAPQPDTQPTEAP